jgi:hypothetical protein
MKLRVLLVGIGIIILVAGGILAAVGVGEFVSCSSSFSCSSSSPTALVVLGEIVFLVGIVVIITGAVLGMAPHLKGAKVW